MAEPSDNVNDNVNYKSFMPLTYLVKGTLQHFAVLAAYVTIETEKVSQPFLKIKGVVGLLRTSMVMFECLFIAGMLGSTVHLRLRRGVLQTCCVMVFNATISGMLVSIIDPKLRFCKTVSVLWGFACLIFFVLEGPGIAYQTTRLRSQIRNRISGAADPSDIRDVEDE